MNVRETLIEILEDIVPDLEPEGSTALVSGGELKSFDVLQLVSEINSEFDIQIPLEDIVPANFDSLEAMTALVEKQL